MQECARDTYKLKRIGLKIEPCGSPLDVWRCCRLIPAANPVKSLRAVVDLMKSNITVGSPNLDKIVSKISGMTLSNAPIKSKNTVPVRSWELFAVLMSEIRVAMLSEQDRPLLKPNCDLLRILLFSVHHSILLLINLSKTLCKLLAREIGRKADFFPGLGIKMVK